MRDYYAKINRGTRYRNLRARSNGGDDDVASTVTQNYSWNISRREECTRREIASISYRLGVTLPHYLDRFPNHDTTFSLHTIARQHWYHLGGRKVRSDGADSQRAPACLSISISLLLTLYPSVSLSLSLCLSLSIRLVPSFSLALAFPPSIYHSLAFVCSILFSLSLSLSLSLSRSRSRGHRAIGLTIGWIPAIEKPFSQVRDGTRQNPVVMHDGYRKSHMRCTVVVATTTATTATQRAVKCPHSRAAAPTAGVYRSGHRGTRVKNDIQSANIQSQRASTVGGRLIGRDQVARYPVRGAVRQRQRTSFSSRTNVRTSKRARDMRASA